jgi:hypothetical protein
MPEVIVIDEISAEAEAMAARTIAERGVQLIATAHGGTLDNLLQNPTLSDLVGGIQVVTLSDEEARRRGTQKTVLERKAPPTFDVLVEIQDRDRLVVHHNVAKIVDDFLRGMPIESEIRTRSKDGQIEIQKAEGQAAEAGEPAPPLEEVRRQQSVVNLSNRRHQKVLRIFPYAVNRSRLIKAIQKSRAPACIVKDIEQADLILTLKSPKRSQSKYVRDAQGRGIPFRVVKSNTLTQIESLLQSVFNEESLPEGEGAALRETESAIREVLKHGHPVELSPENTYVRRLQHQLAKRYGLSTESKGADPFRRVVIYPV